MLRVDAEIRCRNQKWTKNSASGEEPAERRDWLRTGDFYLTKHSNLCETHVVFHLVADEQLDANGNMR